MRRIILWLALPIAIGAIAVTACDDPNSDVGARCTVTHDCTPPLICSNRDATDLSGGICVYPEALPDASLNTDASGL
jgi:hypothetical protein